MPGCITTAEDHHVAPDGRDFARIVLDVAPITEQAQPSPGFGPDRIEIEEARQDLVLAVCVDAAVAASHMPTDRHMEGKGREVDLELLLELCAKIVCAKCADQLLEGRPAGQRRYIVTAPGRHLRKIAHDFRQFRLIERRRYEDVIEGIPLKRGGLNAIQAQGVSPDSEDILMRWTGAGQTGRQQRRVKLMPKCNSLCRSCSDARFGMDGPMIATY